MREIEKYFWPLCVLLVLHGSLNENLVYASESPLDKNKPQVIKLYLPIKSNAFAPLIKSLNQDKAQNGFDDIHVETIDHWHVFQQSLRLGRFGIYFAPPHFAAWAISKHGFKPLVRISEPLSYLVTTYRTNRDLFEMNDLAGRRVCSDKPLNLDYLLINSAFNDSLLFAKIEIVNSVADEMRDPATHCEAFSVTNHLFDQFAIEAPDRFIQLLQSPRYNNYALLVHPDITDYRARQLQRYFLQQQTQSLLAPMLKLFARDGKLVRSTADDYPPSYWQVLSRYWRTPERAAW